MGVKSSAFTRYELAEVVPASDLPGTSKVRCFRHVMEANGKCVFNCNFAIIILSLLLLLYKMTFIKNTAQTKKGEKNNIRSHSKKKKNHGGYV